MALWNKKSKKTPDHEMVPAEAHLSPHYEQTEKGCGSGGCGSGGCHSTQNEESHDHAHEHGHHEHHEHQANDQKTSPEALIGVRHIIAIASGKGGVGKSTVTTNLAIALRQMGATVGLLDADLYGPTQPGMLGTQGTRGKTNGNGLLVPTEKHGVKVVSIGLLTEEDSPMIWRAPMATQMIQQFLGNVQWGTLDYLLIDLPPGTGDVQLTLAQNARLTGTVIVTTPQEVAVGIAKKGLEMFRQLNIPILGIVENMSGFTCKHCEKETAIFKEGGGQTLAKKLGVPFLGAVPLDPEIMLSGDIGIPIFERAPKSHAAEAFLKIAAAVDKKIEQIEHESHDSHKTHEPHESRPLENEMEIQIKTILEDQVNPSLAGHGGRVDLVEIKDGNVYLAMSGGCQGCGSAQMTIQQGVEKTLRAQVVGIKEVIDITDHKSGKNPYYK